MEKLKQILAQEDTVLFIGSGISLWSGLPSWGGMIEELAQFVESTGGKADLIRAEADKGDLLQAASYGFDKLTKQQIGDFIRSSCRYGITKPSEIHRKIVSLGPRCFVTTNYDNLIEESLRQWLPDRFFRPPVTNRQLTETAEVVHARAIDFIFKPHGDAHDSESIILTREQYRQLLPGGERQAALESLKMLLASRPFVYLGFGLRDPDFIYLRDLLSNTYKGGTRDHYAIMADVSDAECDYWRRNYGIHLVNYATTEDLNKTRDHTALLALLDALLEKTPASPAVIGFDPHNPNVILALARHAAGLARIPKINPEFQIRVHIQAGKRRGNSIYYIPDKFDHCPAEKFLDEGPERALLIGLPGSGKTYSLRRAAARLSDKLQEACLTERFDETSALVPIFVDLKSYRGNLGELVCQSLPKNLPFDEVTQFFKVKIFLDSFNEMPREYWESGSYESDFAKFINRIGTSSLVIGSRTSDGLGELGLPAYCLDQIEEEAVTAELQRLGIEIESRFNHEIRWLLQRPFYFRYVLDGTVILPKEAHPQDFFRVFFENLRTAFSSRFNEKLNIEKALSLSAYNALNLGEEAFPLTDLLHILKTSVESLGTADINVHDVANWLVSSSVLIPYTGGRVAFVHQSVTEYLAASELALRYQSSPHILKEKLSYTRWDQALFLTLSLLPAEQANKFFHDVIKADFVLALNAAKYLEVGRDEIVTKLLSEIPKHIEKFKQYDHKIASASIFDLPITIDHEPQLRALIKYGNYLGAYAVSRLVEIKGAEIKDELLQLLVNCSDDICLCNGIALDLQSFATAEDIQKIAALADAVQEKIIPHSEEYDLESFTSSAAMFLSQLDLSIIWREFFYNDESMQISNIRARIFCDILNDHHSTAALNFAGELLLKGIKEAAISIYFISKFAKPECELSWASFTVSHLDSLESFMSDDEESWELDALRVLCVERPDLAELLKQKALKKTGIEKAALLYCISPADLTPILQALGELIEMSDEERWEQPVRLLKNIKFDWSGREELFVQLLKLRDTDLASALFGGSCPPSVEKLGNLDIGPIDWWLQWMLEESVYEYDLWFVEQLGSLFATHLNNEMQDKFVAEFNKSDSKFHRVLLRFVLPFLEDIKIDVFSEDAISFILVDLNRKGSVSVFPEHLLCKVATEQFITERLLPLIPGAKQPLLENLHKVLRKVGSRHGKRYILG
jgi:hypothetical protein